MGRRVSNPLRPQFARNAIALLLATAMTGFAGPAFADKLEVAAGAPWWMHLGAGALLWLHIGGGTLGMASGAVALLARKGGRLHRQAGAVFFVSMLVMSGIGGAVAPFLHDRISSVAGFMTFYLILTGWMTARRRQGVGALEVAGLFIALGGVTGAGTLTWMALQTPEGTLDGSPFQAFYLFTTVSTIALLGDLHVVLRRGISGAHRIARHVWRMCFGLFVATGSLFLGQQQIFPDWIRETPLLLIAGFAPAPFLVFWMCRVLLSRKYRSRPAPVAA